MNYESNKIEWEIGAIVIHDADAKNENMLMKVVGMEKGVFITKYIYPERICPNCLIRKYKSYEKVPRRIKTEYEQTYRNGKEFLHDPKLFGIVKHKG